MPSAAEASGRGGAEKGEAFWREGLPDLLARLEAVDGGLSGVAAAGRLARYGPNVLVVGRRSPGRFFLILVAMVAVYLGGVQVVKLWFYRYFFPEP